METYIEQKDMRDMGEKIFYSCCLFFDRKNHSYQLAKDSFDRLSEKLGIECKKDFDEYIEEFKIEVKKTENIRIGDVIIHPFSPGEIERFLISDIKLFENVLFILSNDVHPVIRGYCASTIGRYFTYLTRCGRELFDVLLEDENPKVRAGLVYAVGQNFKKLPDRYRAFLDVLSDDDDPKVRRRVVSTVGRYFGDMPPDYQELLKKISRDRDAGVRWWVAVTIARNLDKLPGEYRDILINYKKDKDVMDMMSTWIKNRLFDEKTAQVLEGIFGD